ncbi:hypothetical protein DFO55_12412 [Grimontella sp. AG753]|nr:hypothetical protein DFO55_12412 [Grimontella sp. AG753]
MKVLNSKIFTDAVKMHTSLGRDVSALYTVLAETEISDNTDFMMLFPFAISLSGSRTEISFAKGKLFFVGKFSFSGKFVIAETIKSTSSQEEQTHD